MKAICFSKYEIIYIKVCQKNYSKGILINNYISKMKFNYTFSFIFFYNITKS